MKISCIIEILPAMLLSTCCYGVLFHNSETMIPNTKQLGSMLDAYGYGTVMVQNTLDALQSEKLNLFDPTTKDDACHINTGLILSHIRDARSLDFNEFATRILITYKKTADIKTVYRQASARRASIAGVKGMNFKSFLESNGIDLDLPPCLNILAKMFFLTKGNSASVRGALLVNNPSGIFTKSELKKLKDSIRSEIRSLANHYIEDISRCLLPALGAYDLSSPDTSWGYFRSYVCCA